MPGPPQNNSQLREKSYEFKTTGNQVKLTPVDLVVLVRLQIFTSQTSQWHFLLCEVRASHMGVFRVESGRGVNLTCR